MKFLAVLGYLALFLVLVVIGGFGGCLIGGSSGRSRDVKNGTAGKGLEGASHEITGYVTGSVLGAVAGVVVFVALFFVFRKLGATYRERRAQ